MKGWLHKTFYTPLLSPVVINLQNDLTNLFYLLLPAFVGLYLVINFFKNGNLTLESATVIKRTIICVLLLVTFNQTANLVLDVSTGISNRIDQGRSFSKIFEQVKDKINKISTSKLDSILNFQNTIYSIIIYVSFLCLYVIRFTMVCLFNFIWLILHILSPILILFFIFPSTANITGNLYRSLIEVASWKIFWSIFAVILTTMPFMDLYKMEGSYNNIIAFNILVGICMIITPIFVHYLTSSGLNSMAASLMKQTPNIYSRIFQMAISSKPVTKAITNTKKFSANFANKKMYEPAKNSLKNIYSKLKTEIPQKSKIQTPKTGKDVKK